MRLLRHSLRVSLVAVVLAGCGATHHAQPPQSNPTPKPKPTPTRVVTAPGPLPGGLLIADRGNDRILLVDPGRRTLWSFPTAHDRAQGRKLVFDDDTFVEPGGKSLVTNEEEHHDILSIDIATHRVTVLYGHPGIKGGSPGLLNTLDDALKAQMQRAA